MRIDQSGLASSGRSVSLQVARWFVLHVKSRQEKALAAELCRAEVPHYLPLNSVTRYYGRRKTKVIEPLFPGYLFLKGSREQAFTADRTRRVVSIIDVPRQDEFELELSHLRRTLDQVGFLARTTLRAVGVRVEVVSGPFKGIVGRIESWDQRDKLILHVAALGQGAALELDGSLVRPVDE